MARTLYGGSPADVIVQVTVDDGDLAPATATLTAWDSLSGGTQLTDLTTSGGSPITVVTPDGVGRVLFYGPDGYTAALWLEDSTGTRWRIEPSDLASRTGGVTSVQALTGAVSLDADDIPDGSTKVTMTAAERTALANQLTIGATSSTAKAGNWTPALADLATDVPFTRPWPATGSGSRNSSDGSRRCIFVCESAANLPPLITSGTAGRYADDLMMVKGS